MMKAPTTMLTCSGHLVGEVLRRSACDVRIAYVQVSQRGHDAPLAVRWDGTGQLVVSLEEWACWGEGRFGKGGGAGGGEGEQGENRGER